MCKEEVIKKDTVCVCEKELIKKETVIERECVCKREREISDLEIERVKER